MRIIETCTKTNLVQVKNEKNGSSSSLILKYAPLDHVNFVYLMHIWSIYTIYISGKLGPGGGGGGGTYFDIENGDYLVSNFDRK